MSPSFSGVALVLCQCIWISSHIQMPPYTHERKRTSTANKWMIIIMIISEMRCNQEVSIYTRIIVSTRYTPWQYWFVFNTPYMKSARIPRDQRQTHLERNMLIWYNQFCWLLLRQRGEFYAISGIVCHLDALYWMGSSHCLARVLWPGPWTRDSLSSERIWRANCFASILGSLFETEILEDKNIPSQFQHFTSLSITHTPIATVAWHIYTRMCREVVVGARARAEASHKTSTWNTQIWLCVN